MNIFFEKTCTNVNIDLKYYFQHNRYVNYNFYRCLVNVGYISHCIVNTNCPTSI